MSVTPASAEGTITSGPACLAMSVAAFWISTAEASDAPPNFQISSGTRFFDAADAWGLTLPATCCGSDAVDRPAHRIVVIRDLHWRVRPTRSHAFQAVRVV